MHIQNQENFPLFPPEQELLAQMFAKYERLVLKAELGGGFGGGRVLLVRPITVAGAELPAVVKLGRAAIIQREWAAFARFVHQKVPKIARIEGQPVWTADGEWGGIRYPLAGDGRFHTESLGMFSRHATIEDIAYVLEHQLFPSMSALWQDTAVIHEFALGRSLDAVLPVNLVLSYTEAASAASEWHSGRHYPTGAKIVLANFVVTEVDHPACELTLDCPATAHGESGGHRIRVTAVPDTTAYQEGQRLPRPITGTVQATRHELLQAQVDQIFGSMVQAKAATLSWSGMGTLPNPLAHLPAILKQTGDVRVGPIHGDLNLENILVEYDHKSRTVYLIDFASARKDWVLHDLLRLETGYWLYLVPEVMKDHGRDLTDLPHFMASLQAALADPTQIEAMAGLEKPLHILVAIRRMAQHLLATPHVWEPYLHGLIVYLVGALKFKNLDSLPTAPLPKQVAFMTAALLLQQLEGKPMPVRPNAAMTQTNLVPLPDLMRQIRLLLPECEPFESQHQLRAFFVHPQLKSWRNRLPEEHRLSARVDGVIALLHQRTHVETGINALVLLLHILSQEPNTDEDLQPKLAKLADQLEIALTQNSLTR